MFEEKVLDLLDGKKQVIGQTTGTLQPYDKTLVFEGGMEFPISESGFCEDEPKIKLAHYVRCNEHVYKIMKIKEWSDFYEIHLYKCGG